MISNTGFTAYSVQSDVHFGLIYRKKLMVLLDWTSFGLIKSLLHDVCTTPPPNPPNHSSSYPVSKWWWQASGWRYIYIYSDMGQTVDICIIDLQTFFRNHKGIAFEFDFFRLLMSYNLTWENCCLHSYSVMVNLFSCLKNGSFSNFYFSTKSCSETSRGPIWGVLGLLPHRHPYRDVVQAWRGYIS